MDRNATHGRLAHIRRNAVAYAALFVALGGTGAYAASAVLPENSVGTEQLRNRAVAAKKLKANSVTTKKVADGSLLSKDFAPGELAAPSVGERGPQGATGPQGARGPQGEQGLVGPQGPAGPGAVPISVRIAEGTFTRQEFPAGPLRLAVSCSPREDRPQIQVWGAREQGTPAGTIYWTGIRTSSIDQEFLTDGLVDLGTDLGGLESRWAPAGGYAGESMQFEYRSGPTIVTVNLHLMADDRGTGSCTAAGTAVVAG